MVFIALNSILELLESAYSCTSSAFLSHHWFCMLRSSRCALALQSLYLSRLEEQFGWFCQSMNAFLFSSSSACTASSFSSNDENTYIHTYINTYIYTYLHTYIQTYIHTYIHTYLHTCIHTFGCIFQMCTRRPHFVTKKQLITNRCYFSLLAPKSMRFPSKDS